MNEEKARRACPRPVSMKAGPVQASLSKHLDYISESYQPYRTSAPSCVAPVELLISVSVPENISLDACSLVTLP